MSIKRWAKLKHAHQDKDKYEEAGQNSDEYTHCSIPVSDVLIKERVHQKDEAHKACAAYSVEIKRLAIRVNYASQR